LTKRQQGVSVCIVLLAAFLLGAVTVVNLATQVTGVLPLVNGGTGGTSYVKGEFHTFCTGLTLTTATTNFDFPGFGGIVTTCASSNISAVSGTKMPTAGTVKNLFVNLGTAGKSGDKVTMLKNGSATGAPTCTYATATTCNDVATALTVAAGDIITISISTSAASETSANVAVSFELWN
jgi:hypothetical protein